MREPSERELLLLSLAAEGWTFQRIGRRCGMSTAAATQALYRFRRRVGVSSTAHLVAVAFRQGWLE
jgi:DNA-binding NarL/FixJ family response regulator